VADAGARRHDAEVVERVLAPFQELVTLHVALVFAVHVHLEGARIAEFVDHHRVVDDQIDRVQRVDLLRLAADRDDRVAHCGQIDHRRNAGEILHQNARRAVRDFVPATGVGRPRGCGFDVVGRNRAAVFKAQQVFNQDLDGIGQFGYIAEASLLGGFKAEIIVRFTVYLKGAAGFERVLSGHLGFLTLLFVSFTPTYVALQHAVRLYTRFVSSRTVIIHFWVGF